jgi:hypothetical protein
MVVNSTGQSLTNPAITALGELKDWAITLSKGTATIRAQNNKKQKLSK